VRIQNKADIFQNDVFMSFNKNVLYIFIIYINLNESLAKGLKQLAGVTDLAMTHTSNVTCRKAICHMDTM